MTTQVAERKPQKDVVSVLCSGIACEVGFALTPEGFDQSFATFQPLVPLEMERHYADFLIAQDPTKFSIIAKKKDATKDETAEEIKARKDAAKAAKKAAKAAKK